MPNHDLKSNPNNLTNFCRLLTQYFSLDEFRTLCFDLEIRYDDLGGEGISGKARELISLMGRYGRFPALQQVVQASLPHVDWPDITKAQLPPSLELYSDAPIISVQGNIIGSAIGQGSSVQAENIAGRDINVFNFSSPLGSSTVISVLSNHIDLLGEKLSEQARLKLSDLKNIWRQGKREEALNELQNLQNDRIFWGTISNEIKAQILCFEGSIHLHLTDNIQIAIEFADKAQALANTSNEARLRAFIAFAEGKLPEGIEVLADWTDAESLHLRASFFLELREPDQCLQILQSEPIASSPTAETYRLRALSYLVQKEVNQAQLEIQKALELGGSWKSVRFSAAIVNYYSAVALGGFEKPIVLSAEPISWVLIKRDDESLSRLRQAAAQLQELMQSKEQISEEISRFQTWYLASLANDPEKQEEADNYCRTLLAKNPIFTPAIGWALARGYEFDSKTCELALEKHIEKDTSFIYRILALVNCYITNKNFDQAAELLEQKESVFQEQGVIEAWLHAFAQVQVLMDSPETALQKIDEYEPTVQAVQARILTLHSIAYKTDDWQSLNDFLQRLYDDTNDPDLFLISCEIKAQQQDWFYIFENSATLLSYFETAKVLELVAIAAYNIEHFHQCLQLLDNNHHLFPNSELPIQLKRIRIFCLHELGILPEAILEAKNLASETPALENLIPLINLYVTTGDFKSLALIARQLERLAHLPAEIALQVSRLLIWEDRKLAVSLWNKAVEQELPDELVGNAFMLGNQLGLKTELKSLSFRLQQLGQQDKGGIISISAQEVLDFFRTEREQGSEIYEAYQGGRLPIHFVSQRFNWPISAIYHANLVENEKKLTLLTQLVLLARHGGRILMEGFPVPDSDYRLHLDITAVLLAEHLNILTKIERAFAPLHIPAELVPALIQLREQITPHQPTRYEESKQIVELVKNGTISVLREELPSEFENALLTDEMGADWVILAYSARNNNGFLVDYLPLRKRDLSGHPPSTVPEDIGNLLVNCRALVESLLQEGPLSVDEYNKALDELGNEGEVDPSEIVPPQGLNLYLDGVIPTTLAGANLLRVICQRFRVYISSQVYERLKAELDSYAYMQMEAGWVDNLISRLNIGLEKQTYQVISVSTEKRKLLNDIAPQHPLDGVLNALLGFEMQQGDVIWTDDRWLNSYRHRDGVPVVDVCDILKLLVGSGHMNEAEYYHTLHKLRSGNVIFIPTQHDEIIHYLTQAQIDPKTNNLVETQQLIILRQHIASCLLQKSILQKPPMPPGSPNEQGETPFVINLMHSITSALFDIWTSGNVNEEHRPILSEWILDNLYLDYLSLARAASLPIEEENQLYLAAIGLVALLTAPITSSINNVASVQASKAYFTWLNDRLLQRRFSADPQLLISCTDSLKSLFQNTKENIQGKQDSIAIDWLLQTYYDDLPEQIQQELQRDSNFMSNFDLGFIRVISVADLVFQPRQFFEAAHKAINGNKATIVPVHSKTKIIFEPVENELAFSFVHPGTNEKAKIVNERLVLLLDSPIEREKMLYQQRHWFDCSEKELRQAISLIAVTEDILRRVEIADQWIESSPYLYYKNLYEQMIETQQIHFPSLIPPNADRLLSHYRLLPTTGTGRAFVESFALASTTLLQEEGLGTAIHRLVGFPVSLPISVLEAIGDLTESEAKKLVRDLLKSAGSPLSKIHLIKILVHLGQQNISYYRLARRIAKGFFAERGMEEFLAFSNLLRWITKEFNHWSESDRLQPHMLLAMAWAHTHQIFSIFTALNIPLDWIAETFERSNRRLPTETFNRINAQWFDIAHPRRLDFPVFILMGLADSIGQSADVILDQNLGETIVQIGFQILNEHILPAVQFLSDNQCASNSLETFMGNSYSEALTSIFGEELTTVFRNWQHQDFAHQAILTLIEKPNNFSSWFTLRVILRDLPPYVSVRDELTQLLIQTQFTNLLENEPENGLATLEFAAMQLLHLWNEELNQHVKVHFAQTIEHLANQAETHENGQNSILGSWEYRLIEIALNISSCNQTIDERVLEFRDFLSQIINLLPQSRQLARTIVQTLCEELPIKYAQHFGELLLRLRIV